MACTLCTEPITDAQMKTQLLCTHDFHTECILRRLVNVGTLVAVCPNCEDHIIPPNMLPTEYEDTVENENEGVNELNRLYRDEPTFSQGLKEIKMAVKHHNLRHRLLKATISDKHTTYMAEMKPVFDLMKDKYKNATNEIRKHANYIAIRRSDMAYNTRIRKFCRTWNVEKYVFMKTDWESKISNNK